MAKWILMKDSGLKGLRAYQKQRTKENLSGKKCKRRESEMDQSREFKGGRGYSPRRSSSKRVQGSVNQIRETRIEWRGREQASISPWAVPSC
jgi:hypothetical protein